MRCLHGETVDWMEMIYVVDLEMAIKSSGYSSWSEHHTKARDSRRLMIILFCSRGWILLLCDWLSNAVPDSEARSKAGVASSEELHAHCLQSDYLESNVSRIRVSRHITVMSRLLIPNQGLIPAPIL